MPESQCAWCATDKDRALWAFYAAIGRYISHGLCRACEVKFFQ